MPKTREITLEEKEFAKMHYNKLISLFMKHRSISVHIGDKDRLDLAYIKSYYTGNDDNKYSDVIIFSHARRLPREYIDNKDEERFTIVTKEILSPLKINKAIKTFQNYYRYLKESKAKKIKNFDFLEETLFA